jgi:putative transposase
MDSDFPLDLVIDLVYHWSVKLTLQTQLLPDPDQAARLQETVERFNEAADWLAGLAFERKVSNKIVLQRLAYKELRDRFGISAQHAVRCIAQVCEAYKRDKSIRPRFRKRAAVPYDRRLMSFKGVDRVSLLTLEGRVIVPFVMGKYQAEQFTHAKGQCDLVLREDGKWFLLVTVDLPDRAPTPTTDFIGVDLGLANIATDSDGEMHSGKPVDDVRRKHNLQRKRLQRRGTRGAKKKLRRVAKKGARFRRHENHRISKEIVETAGRTGRGIAVEDLKGIRERVTARGGDARNRLSGWSFHQLHSFLAYKAQVAGVPVIEVDPRYTSQTCPECGHRERSNRKGQSEFCCLACGHEQHADVVGARNIRNAALSCDRALAASKSAIGLDSRKAELESPAL